MSHKTVNLFILLSLFMSTPLLASEQEKKKLDPADELIKRLEEKSFQRLDTERKSETTKRDRKANLGNKESRQRSLSQDRRPYHQTPRG